MRPQAGPAAIFQPLEADHTAHEDGDFESEDHPDQVGRVPELHRQFFQQHVHGLLSFKDWIRRRIAVSPGPFLTVWRPCFGGKVATASGTDKEAGPRRSLHVALDSFSQYGRGVAFRNYQNRTQERIAGGT